MPFSSVGAVLLPLQRPAADKKTKNPAYGCSTEARGKLLHGTRSVVEMRPASPQEGHHYANTRSWALSLKHVMLVYLGELPASASTTGTLSPQEEFQAWQFVHAACVPCARPNLGATFAPCASSRAHLEKKSALEVSQLRATILYSSASGTFSPGPSHGHRIQQMEDDGEVLANNPAIELTLCP
eukprot:2565776-Amphidinium_carterae.1